MATRVYCVVLSFIRKPTSFDILVSLWWFALIATALVGLLGAPSEKLSNELGYEASRFVVSGSLLVLASLGFAARFLKAHIAESNACFGTGVFTTIHGLILILLGTESGTQTGARIFAASFLIFAFGIILRQPSLLLKVRKTAREGDDNVGLG